MSDTPPLLPDDPVAPPPSPAMATADAPAIAVAVAADAAPLPAEEPARAAPVPRVPDLSPAECAARLAELFPALFATIPNTPPRPIKLRIQADIQQRAPEIFTRRVLSHFLHRHTTTTAYLRALVASPHRYDLDGAPAGEVLDEHRQAAQLELDRRRAIVEERRAAERQARQAAARGAGRDGGQAERQRPGPGPDGAAQRDHAVRDGPARPPRRSPGPQRPAAREPQARPPHADHAPASPPRPKAHARVPTQTTPRTPDPVELSSEVPVAEAVPAPAAAPVVPPPAIVDDPARRERALLLRAFESSPLSRANFCALKRIEPAALDALLEQARREAPPKPAAPLRRPEAPRRPPPARRHSR